MIMKGDDLKYDRIDQMIEEALKEAPAGPVPGNISSRVLVRIESTPVLKELAMESTLKLSLVIGVFVVLVTSLILFGVADLYTLQGIIEKYRMIIIPALIISLFTWLFNDIVLKYLFRKSESKHQGAW